VLTFWTRLESVLRDRPDLASLVEVFRAHTRIVRQTRSVARTARGRARPSRRRPDLPRTRSLTLRASTPRSGLRRLTRGDDPGTTVRTMLAQADQAHDPFEHGLKAHNH
jgi:hypothetical protein